MGSEQNSDFYALSIQYLRAGMLLPDDVYDEGQRILLLKKGYVLTDDLLQKLQSLNGGRSTIRVSRETISMIMESENMPARLSQQLHEETLGYTGLTEEAKVVFDAAAQSGHVSGKTAQKITADLSQKLDASSPEDIFRCIDAPRAVDEALQRHSVNVAFLNGLLAGWLGLGENARKTLVLAGLLHDIGKTKIPKEILDAPRRLTDEEFLIIKKHPEYSYELLGESFSRDVLEAVRFHHERRSGTGYPRGLDGESIPLFSKITAVSDVYDAMVSKRSYKEACQPFLILEKLAADDFQGLDAAVSETFCVNMALRMVGRQVLMSDGHIGIVRFVPPNDMAAPVIESRGTLRQVDSQWQCVQAADQSDEAEWDALYPDGQSPL